MYNRNKYLKKKLAGLSPEERDKELARLAEEERLAYWRERGLKAWADNNRRELLYLMELSKERDG